MEVVINRRVRRRRRLVRLFFRLMLLSLVLVAASAVGLLSYTKMQGPPPLNVAQTTVYYGADNSPIGEHHQGENRHWVALSSIDPDVVDATIAIEDRRFYRHWGFDVNRIGGAILANIRSGSRAQGASTLTQQYARNLYLSHDKTWKRKWNELLYSLRLEMNYDKDKILEGYLNTVYYGHGAYGIEAAAQHYFGKSANRLSLAEASMLSGIPKGPSYYSPLFDLERAKKRQAVVLQSMVAHGVLNQVEADEAHLEPLEFVQKELDRPSTVGPYFQDVVERQLIEEIGVDPALIEAGGLKVYTTLDPNMQKQAEYWVEREMPDNDLQTALVAMDPRTGDVKAMVGGTDYVESPYNRAVQASRSPGSAFKPYLYYAALENGYTTASTLLSEPTTFNIDDGRKTWSPRNFNDNYANDFITLLQAMAFSDNIYAVKTHLYLGTDKAVELARRVGIESPLYDHASLALGTEDVTVLEMARGYSAFANGGSRVEPRFIRKVVDAEGEVLFESEPTLTQVLDPKLSFIITDIMTGMFDPYLNAHASVTGRSVAHLINRPAAGKSGSTSTDSWMVGYTPQLVTSVWVGFNEGTLNHSAYGQIAKKIWANFTEQSLKGQPVLPFEKPDGVVGVKINPQNGLLANEHCPTHRVSYFIEGTEPTTECPPPAENGEEVEVIDETTHEKERFLDRFFKLFGH
ncbi:transglycosylase domain-containing protein [Halalkalibacter akibai]|uniref:Multimodular transpeptidase-transglycosylase n=1 Tax=Halalkalibacter akibai (strain ATCC 43226 / DSM 21942 / CIP 109018 / JCM 9157 / 1139) TaxID=1236973 RepID=W4QNA9_HALA3|nr:penicillin-binding protein 1A [Halalkalibacter akibai]GAE33590.1 multimodular transpeptidase-transglycosylase [Halalkalibacter akibai JCM 9157]